MEKRYILTQDIAERKLQRIALQIAEQNIAESQIILLGIKGNGLIIAQKIAAFLQTNYSGDIKVVEVGIDKKQPKNVSIEVGIDFTNKVIVLIDDVANSGKTMLYALLPLLEFYPKKIQTAVLVERTHKFFPIEVDYIGLSISTTFDEHITVEVDGDTITGAWMES